MMADPGDDPRHPILPDPYSREMLEFTYRRDPDDGRETYIDPLLVRDGAGRRLRFFAPREVEMPRGVSGVMGRWCRVYVADVRGRQMEGIGVRAGSFEPGRCVPSFWAASVIEVAEPRGS